MNTSWLEPLENRTLLSANPPASPEILAADRAAITASLLVVAADRTALAQVASSDNAVVQRQNIAGLRESLVDAKAQLKFDAAQQGEERDLEAIASDRAQIAQLLAEIIEAKKDLADIIAVDRATAKAQLAEDLNQLAEDRATLKFDLKGRGTEIVLTDLDEVREAKDKVVTTKFLVLTGTIQLRSDFRDDVFAEDVEAINDAREQLRIDSIAEDGEQPDPEIIAEDRAILAAAIAKLKTDRADLAQQIKVAADAGKATLTTDKAAVKTAKVQLAADLKAGV